MISYICSSELVVVSSRLLCGLNPVFLFPYRQRVVYYLRKSICVVVQVFIGRTFWPKVFLYDTKCILRLPSGRTRSCRIEGKYSCFQLHAVYLLLFGRTENWLAMMPTSSALLVAMGLLPNKSNCGCACARNAGNVFPATAGKQSRHASRHVRDARAVMHAGIANSRFPLNSAAGGNVPGIPGACATRDFTYLVRGPL